MKQLQPTSVDEYIAEHKWGRGELARGGCAQAGKPAWSCEGLLVACTLPKEAKKTQ